MVKKGVFSLAIFLVLSFIGLNFPSSAQVSSSGPLPPEIIASVDDLAKDLAALLSQPGVRNKLRVAINQSARREKIVFLDEFLTDVEKTTGLPDQARGKARGLLSKAAAAKKKFNEPAIKDILLSPEIEVYFPVRNHRDKWTGGDDVLVAVGTLDEKATQIKVYSVKTQKASYISAATPPSDPVIVVVPSEHASYEPGPILEDRDLPAEKPAPAPPGKNSYILTNFFYITTKSEPWIQGDPEIYVWVVQATTSRNIRKAKVYLPGVNDEGKWKDLANCPTALGFYWDDTYDKITYYQVMEEDSGTIISTPVTVAYSGVSVTFNLTIKNEDDQLGSINIDRNAVGWCPYGAMANCCQCYTSQWSTGKAMMRMTLAH